MCSSIFVLCSRLIIYAWVLPLKDQSFVWVIFAQVEQDRTTICTIPRSLTGTFNQTAFAWCTFPSPFNTHDGPATLVEGPNNDSNLVYNNA